MRAFADGFVALLLPVYLTALGCNAVQIGLLASLTLAGSAAVTLSVGFLAHRIVPRLLLLGASLAMALTGLAFAGFSDFWPLAVVAFVGTLNPSGGDVSLFLPLEHSLLAHAVADRDRTALFSNYSLIAGLVGALGALAAGLPDLLGALLPRLEAIRGMFGLYALAGLVVFFLYRRLPVAQADTAIAHTPLGPSRKRVIQLAAVFSLDSFGGGFLVQSLLALWLFDRFGLSLAQGALFFFWAGLLAAASFLVAPRLAKRFGLINTMVFTHIPASLCLIAAAFTPSLWAVLALLLVRAFLSSMDVPARTSYVMAVVTPPERAAAASFTAVPRSLTSAAGPTIAGWMLSLGGFAWPLLVGGGLKIAYDLLMLFMFRNVRAPEEAAKSVLD
ncbi:MFS family permease [Caulobacter ginsengisoli]|uniref:MFS family permease n=1 Tax=Caulobacter ginsengisoli TaxID=400775 RepID=A0ABU0IRG4_9CAUL|nr:MFS transporter [Caulobacter ginsengisoli]MDQ0463589.1 MFS family permease [Caulobacter ginsengisoli]